MPTTELLRERTTASSDSFDTVLGRLNTVTELLRYRALNQPDQLAYTFLADGETEGERQTYAELDRRARAIGTRLQMLETSGQRALLLYPSGLDYIAAFFGCLYAGVIAVPAYPPHPSRITRNLPRIRAIVNDSQPSIALTSSSLLYMLKSKVIQNPDLQEMRWIATDQLEDDLGEQWREPTLSGNTVAFLQYTSGSTATPKGVIVTHENLLHNEQLIKLAFQQTERSVIVGWLPLYHDMGLIGNILQPLYLGASCILMSPSAFLVNPFRWLQAISRYSASTSGGPNFAYDLCVRKISPAQRTSLDLSSWTTAFNGAEPIREETLERFAAAFEPCGFRREAFSPCYGLAEATLLVSGDIKTGSVVYTVEASGLERNKVIAAPTKNELTRTLVSCGRALLDQKIVIAEPASSTLCPPDEVGEIWLSGPSVTRGYWARPEETAQTFGAYLADTGEGPFLRTGDLGFLNNGQLFITGRFKDLIVIRGRNHYPQDIELTVERSHPALRPGGGAAFSIEAEGEERLVVVQEVESRKQQLDFTEVIDSIRQNIAEEHEVQAFAILLVKPGTIAKTSSGKIQHFACRSKFQEGDLNVVSEWRSSAAPESEELPVDIATASLQDAVAIEAWLAALLAIKLKLDASQVDVNQPIARYGVDSLMAIELTHSVEARLGIVLPVISFLQSPSIAQLAAKAASQLIAAPSGDEAILTPARERMSEHPLSYNQRALWFLHQLAPESAAYNIASLVRIKSDLNVSALRRSFQALVDRHESLRTTFGVTEAGEPLQRVHEQLEVSFQEENVAAWNAADLDNYFAEDVHRPFDLEHGPLLRIKLLKRSDQEYILLLVLHHLITDLWSLSVLVNELGILYLVESVETQVTLPPLALQYSDYSRWQTDLLAGPGSERLWSYWEKQLPGELPVLNLPTDRPRPSLQTYQGASRPFELSAELTQRLKELSEAHGATLYMTLLAAFQTLLHRHTGQERILVGSPTAGRSLAELAGLVGYFVNPVVLLADFSGDPIFGEFLDQVRQTVLTAFEHQDYPFALLVEKLQPQRDPSRSPVFQTMFVFQKTSVLKDEGLASFALGEAGARMDLGGLSVESLSLPQRIAQFDLTLNVTETQKGLAATLEYNKDLFEAATIERMVGHFQVLLEAITANPAAHLSSLPLLTPAERQTLLQWNEPSAAYPSDKCLHQLFEEQVERRPDAVAVIFEEQQLSYGELNQRVNQLAHHLRRMGVGPEVLVGVLMERSAEMLIGMLGILKAGGAYVPLDPNYPQERLSFMLEDAEAKVVLTQERLRDRLPEWQAEIICVDSDWELIAAESSDDPLPLNVPGNLAYLIYTSGSTGRPKGVSIEHRNAVTLLHWAKDVYTPAEYAGVLASTSICFDLSVFELFVPLSWGGKVIMAENALQLPLLPAAQEVTLINTVPSAMAELARDGGVPASVRVVNLAGEPLKRTLVKAVYRLEGVEKVFNLYGPSEDTTYSTFELVPDGDGGVSIGRPVANTGVYLLNEQLQLVPAGVPAQLYIGGEGLARGYHRRPELTAEQFVPNPFSAEPGARLYRTGDLARYLANGELDYLGRVDHQVKIRGFRVEVGEVETVLEQHEAIKQAVVAAWEAEAGGKRLVAYVVSGQSKAPATAELRAFLKQRLPDYMVPAAFIFLTELPLTANGKVNRRGLPEPEPGRPELSESYVGARTETEALVCALWEQILKLERVGINDNFFELGGHSLLATQLMSQVRKAFGVEIALRVLFEQPTVAGLTGSIEAEMSGGRNSAAPIQRLSREGPLPLSFSQQRLWFLDQLTPGSVTYNMPIAIRLSGSLHLLALQQTFTEILRRHEVLRTSFPVIDGAPVQLVSEPRDFDLPVIDLSHLERIESERQVQQLASEEAQRPFDFTQAPLFRARLLRLAAAEHVLLLTMHHIISDGWSMGVLIKEVTTLYEAFSAGQPSPLAELPVQYGDYAVWQREQLQGEVLEEQLSYWREQLSGAPAVLGLPTDRVRPAVKSNQSARERLEISAELTAALKALSREQGVTLFMVLLAAFKVLLWRNSGQADVVVGTPIANRRQPEIEGLIGFFVNTLALRTSVEGNESFKDLLKRVREVCLGAYQHQDVPFEMVVEEMAVERANHTPIFQVMFVLQNTPASELLLEDVEISVLEVDSGTAKFDLMLTVREDAGRLSGQVEYDTDLFEAASIKRMVGHYERLLQEVVRDGQQAIGAVPMLGAEERQQLLWEWNEPSAAYPSDKCLHQLFEEQVERRPDAVAVIFEEQQLSYGELNQRVNQLAHHLRRMGVGPEVLVGVLMERSAEMLIGMLGILKAGGAYVPLDPNYPQERLSFMLEDAEAKVVLTQERLRDRLPEWQAEIICVDSDWELIAAESSDDPLPLNVPGNLAYLIYTSGSTGRPKGVSIEHRNAVTLLHWAKDVYTPAEYAGVLASTSICFDLSVFELFVPLSWGGKVIMAENALQLPLLPAAQEVTLINTVPSAMAELARDGGVPASVRVVNLAGEPLKRTLVKAVYRLEGVEKVFNLYGPSEDTTYSTFELVPDGDGGVSIGRPVANTGVYLLNEQLQLVPAGVPAQLYIGGEGLARGYHRRPELTAEQFVPNPFSAEPGARLYRTGDLARYLANGELDYLGRVDHQVKIRGFRVEVGEVETVLEQHEQIKQAVVAAWEAEAGGKRLVAYVVSGQSEAPATAELRAFLKQRLPDYMVPAAFIFLTELPLTASGKVNRRGLPEPEPGRPELSESYVGARTETEALVCSLWGQILKLERVGINDNFFELGGHSLLATQLMSQVRKAFGVEIALRVLFEQPTVAGLTGSIEAEMSGGRNSAAPIQRLSREGPVPLSFSQQRLWFLDQLTPGSVTYNMPIAIRLSGSLHLLALQQTFTEILRRHEVLRTSFPVIDGAPVQLVSEPRDFDLPVIDLSHLERRESEQQVQRLASEEAQRPFDLTQAPLFRATLLRLAAAEHVLLLTMHHIISDGWSMGVLIKEVTTLYEAFSAGQPSPLAELPVQYGDYAVWQREQLHGETLEEQLQYWREQLQGAPVLLELPTENPRLPVQSYRGAQLTLEVAPQTTRALKVLSQQHGVTLFMTLLAAFQVLLYRYTGQDDIVVGTPVAGRTRAETEGLIGFFLNTLALRVSLKGDPTFAALLSRVREACLGAYAHQDVPFEQLLEELAPERTLSHTPIFQVMFNMLNFDYVGEQIELDGLKIDPLPVAQQELGAKFDLELYARELGDGLQLLLVYSELFTAVAMEQMLGHLHTLLQAVAAEPERHLATLALSTDLREQRPNQNSLIRPTNPFVFFANEEIEQTIQERFEKQVRNYPGNIAIKIGKESWTYKELNHKANQIARAVLTASGGDEQRIALLLNHDAPMVAGILGVLKAGKTYVPLDAAYPEQRLIEVLKDSEAAGLLTDNANLRFAEALSKAGLPVINLDRIDASTPGDNLQVQGAPDALAYILYTSGSTGQPKGVMQNHRNVLHHIRTYTNNLHICAGDKVTLLSSYAFDAAVMDIFAALLNGATLCPIDLRTEALTMLLERLTEEEITIYHSTPTVYRYFVNSLREQEVGPSIRLVVLGGEEVQKRDFELYRQHFSPLCLFVNGLGPTESTVSLQYFVDQQTEITHNTVPVGQAVENTDVSLCNEAGEQVAIYGVGEIVIKSPHVALGYWRRPELTRTAFLNASADGYWRSYRTGDLGRWLPNGTIEFVGRRDYQVKIRGYRIELDEIEAVLTQHPAIRDSVVVASGNGAAKRLVAYLITDEKQKPTVSDLRRFLSEKLPGYMVPSGFALLDEMPMTTNGKVDRHALPAPEQLRIQPEDSYEAPRNTIEETLVEMWAEVLGIERVGIHDNFFNLGGHSLLVTQLNSRVKERFQVEIALRSMFESPTVATLAQLIEQSPAQPKNKNVPKLTPAPRHNRRSSLLAKLNNLSEQEAKKMLRERKTLQQREIEHG